MFDVSLFFQVKLIEKTILPRKCINHPKTFCYLCDSFTAKTQRRAITPDLQKVHQLYRCCSLGDQDKDWASHVVCTACSNGLRDSINKRKTTMPFAVPMKWREPKNHVDECYFL